MNYAEIYGHLLERAVLRNLPKKGNARHHWYPKCMGGTNMGTVVLTHREHFCAHLLLVKMAQQTHMARAIVGKLAAAVNLMRKDAPEIARRLQVSQGSAYAWVQKENAERMRAMNKNPVFAAAHAERMRAMHKDPRYSKPHSAAMIIYHASRTAEERKKSMIKARANVSAKNISLAAHNYQMSKTTEERKESMRQALTVLTPEKRSEIGRKGWAAARKIITFDQMSCRAKKANAARSFEERSKTAKNFQASRSATERSLSAHKAWATKRAKREA